MNRLSSYDYTAQRIVVKLAHQIRWMDRKYLKNTTRFKYRQVELDDLQTIPDDQISEYATRKGNEFAALRIQFDPDFTKLAMHFAQEATRELDELKKKYDSVPARLKARADPRILAMFQLTPSNAALMERVDLMIGARDELERSRYLFELFIVVRVAKLPDVMKRVVIPSMDDDVDADLSIQEKAVLAAKNLDDKADPEFVAMATRFTDAVTKGLVYVLDMTDPLKYIQLQPTAGSAWPSDEEGPPVEYPPDQPGRSWSENPQRRLEQVVAALSPYFQAAKMRVGGALVPPVQGLTKMTGSVRNSLKARADAEDQRRRERDEAQDIARRDLDELFRAGLISDKEYAIRYENPLEGATDVSAALATLNIGKAGAVESGARFVSAGASVGRDLIVTGGNGLKSATAKILTHVQNSMVLPNVTYITMVNPRTWLAIPFSLILPKSLPGRQAVPTSRGVAPIETLTIEEKEEVEKASPGLVVAVVEPSPERSRWFYISSRLPSYKEVKKQMDWYFRAYGYDFRLDKFWEDHGAGLVFNSPTYKTAVAELSVVENDPASLFEIFTGFWEDFQNQQTSLTSYVTRVVGGALFFFKMVICQIMIDKLHGYFHPIDKILQDVKDYVLKSTQSKASDMYGERYILYTTMTVFNDKVRINYKTLQSQSYFETLEQQLNKAIRDRDEILEKYEEEKSKQSTGPNPGLQGELISQIVRNLYQASTTAYTLMLQLQAMEKRLRLKLNTQPVWKRASNLKTIGTFAPVPWVYKTVTNYLAGIQNSISMVDPPKVSSNASVRDVDDESSSSSTEVRRRRGVFEEGVAENF